MKRTVTQNPWFDRQPPLAFVELLKRPLHSEVPPHWNGRAPLSGEVDAAGAFPVRGFPDEEGLLDTAYADFERFAALHCQAEGKRYPIVTRFGETDAFEDYTVSVRADSCTITAADTEGIRRGLVYVEDEMLRHGGSILSSGETKRHAYIRTRVSRSFFSPINRPPKNRDELFDDEDYYPDEYLNRLAHDGVNGVWIYTKFLSLIPSDLRTEVDPGQQKRMEKLRRLTAKCRRYGIRPYVFAIEPVQFNTPEEIGKYAIARGASRGAGKAAFCTNTGFGRNYCIEAVYRLFTLCPGLGGMILITHGERGTACGSASMEIDCPRCKDKKIGEVLSQTVDCLMEGLRRAKAVLPPDRAFPPPEFISWTYGHRMWNAEAVTDYVRSAPGDAMLMQNFEEMGYTKQLGKTRLALDYWISYPGPSELYKTTADAAARYEKHLFAKTQVCNSHETATVPYVPVPGLLWEKYRAMRQMNVEGVMQCWYFGSFPSLMSRAAGELSFTGDFSDKDAFLKKLAGLTHGADAGRTVEAWKAFEEGYQKLPVNIMFSYFGPMHDGPVWELQLKPKNFPLPRSWQTVDVQNGDRIYECLLNGHTLDEALTLCEGLAADWKRGLSLLPRETGYGPADEQASDAAALGVQFDSGLNILRFYALRDRLGRLGYTSRGEREKRETRREMRGILQKMREIVENEKANSLALASLCEKDGRLGYHSEGEGYKYFPEMLFERVKKLDALLDGEFSEVASRIDEGKAPLAYYLGEEDDAPVYFLHAGKIEDAAWVALAHGGVPADGTGFRAAVEGGELVLQMKDDRRGSFGISSEFRLLRPDVHLSLSPDGKADISFYDGIYYQAFGEKKREQLARWHVTANASAGTDLTARLKLTDIGQTDPPTPMKLKIVSPSGASLCGNRPPQGSLGKADMNPEDYFWLMLPEKQQAET